MHSTQIIPHPPENKLFYTFFSVVPIGDCDIWHVFKFVAFNIFMTNIEIRITSFEPVAVLLANYVRIIFYGVGFIKDEFSVGR